MNLDNAKELLQTIPASARVVDVGGGAAPFPRADYVIDALPFDKCGAGSDNNIHSRLSYTPKYSQDTWCQLDLCAHLSWPFPDKFFDFAICSHLLEDVRDPIWICHELCRVAKAGYIEAPSRLLEQCRGVENPCYAGYYHHRWLVTKCGNGLEFRHKPHLLHSLKDAIVAQIGAGYQVNPKNSYMAFHWKDSFDYKEVLEFNESAVVAGLCSFAAEARKLPDLVVASSRPFLNRLKRRLYYSRLGRGRR